MNPLQILDEKIQHWIGETNYSLMLWINAEWWTIVSTLIFLSVVIQLSPLKAHTEHHFGQLLLIPLRKMLLAGLALMALLLPINLFLYDWTLDTPSTTNQGVWLHWLADLAKQQGFFAGGALLLGLIVRLVCFRYVMPFVSKTKRKMRHTQTQDNPSDIRDENKKRKAIDFLPAKLYKKGNMLMGVTHEKKPIYTPLPTWYETNMQIIGPTRYGKGVAIGVIMEQTILNGVGLFYIDPKGDQFAPRILSQTAKKMGRKFYYLTLHDRGIGQWSPFTGGSKSEALARIKAAFGLAFTGDPGTDFYKSQEFKLLSNAFNKTQHLQGLKQALHTTDALKTLAELEEWTAIASLNPNQDAGFSIEQALLDNAVVYVQGDLNHNVIKQATQVFLNELIQETRRLDELRDHHVTIVVDEVSFLTSDILTTALATLVGFRANFVLAYQSQNDLLNLNDKTANAQYVYHSINVNCQLKLVHGGADADTAQWIADLSGTISKEVTRSEMTEISGTGGETWNSSRSIGLMEENFIAKNVVLTLPPRVGIFIQPRSLPQVCCTSFVPVDVDPLNQELKKIMRHQARKKRQKLKKRQFRSDAIPSQGAHEKPAPDFMKTQDPMEANRKEEQTNNNSASLYVVKGEQED